MTEKCCDIHRKMLPDAQAASSDDWVAELVQARKALERERAARLRAEKTEYEQRQLAQALADNVSAIHRASDPDQVLTHILGNVGRVVPHTGANVMLIGEEDDTAYIAGACPCYAKHDRDPPSPDQTFHIADTSTLRRIRATGRPLVIQDTASDPGWVDTAQMRWLRSYVGVPIRLEGQIIGFFNLDSDAPGAFSQVDAQRLQVFADQSAITLRQSHLRAQLERTAAELRGRVAELEALVRTSSALCQTTRIEEMISSLIQESVHAVEADAGALLLLQDGALVVTGLHGLASALLGHRHRPCDDVLWHALRAGQSVLFDPAEPGPWAAGGMVQALAPGMAAAAIVPLRSAEGMLGLLQVAFRQPRAFEAYRRPLTAIAEIGGNALQRATVMATLERSVAERTHDLQVLYEVMTTTTQVVDPQTILERVLVQALDAVGGDAGLIHLGDGGAALFLAAQFGLPAERLDPVPAPLPVGGPWAQVVTRGETVILPDWRADFPTFRPSLPAGSRAYIGVPIRAAGRVLGVLSVFAGAIEPFAAEDVALLAAIAHHLGVALERARLREQAEQAALVQERQRLARELHDAVTQSLYGLTLLTGAGRDAARAADLARVEHILGQLGETAQRALKEMRLMIYELHPPALTQEGLAAALRQRLAAVERRAGVTAELVIETPIELPVHVEAALYRMAQEALNNVLKHAQATRVTVRVAADDDAGLTLEVTDNGRGFDPGTVADAVGLGLTSIEERAASLGGSSQVVSQPGGGTRLMVHLPLGPGSCRENS